MITTPDTQKRFRFFLDHAGWASPPGRAVCALELVRIEQLLERAIELEIASVEWLDEEGWSYGDLGDAFSEEEMRELFEAGKWTGPYVCALHIGDERYSTSCGMIVLGPDGLNDPYARVVAAELAAECGDELRQNIGDTLDALSCYAY